MFDEYSPFLQGFVSVDLWRKYKIAELTEVMRQKNKADFINLLSKVRVENIDNDVKNILKTRFISKNNLISYRNSAHFC